MASITLATKEYNELTAKAEAYDQLIGTIIEGYVVKAEDSSWRPYSIQFKPQWSQEMANRIVCNIGRKLSNLPTVMDHIVKEEEYILDMETLQLEDLPYSERLYYGQYNLLECCEDFDIEYNGRKIEAELQLEEKKAEQEPEEEDE